MPYGVFRWWHVFRGSIWEKTKVELDEIERNFECGGKVSARELVLESHDSLSHRCYDNVCNGCEFKRMVTSRCRVAIRGGRFKDFTGNTRILTCYPLALFRCGRLYRGKCFSVRGKSGLSSVLNACLLNLSPAHAGQPYSDCSKHIQAISQAWVLRKTQSVGNEKLTECNGRFSLRPTIMWLMGEILLTLTEHWPCPRLSACQPGIVW